MNQVIGELLVSRDPSDWSPLKSGRLVLLPPHVTNSDSPSRGIIEVAGLFCFVLKFYGDNCTGFWYWVREKRINEAAHQ
jgi:hypothetical protein